MKAETISNNAAGPVTWIIGSLGAVLSTVFILILLKRWLRQRRQSQEYDQVIQVIEDQVDSQSSSRDIITCVPIMIDSEDDDDDVFRSPVQHGKFSTDVLLGKFTICDSSDDDCDESDEEVSLNVEYDQVDSQSSPSDIISNLGVPLMVDSEDDDVLRSPAQHGKFSIDVLLGKFTISSDDDCDESDEEISLNV